MAISYLKLKYVMKMSGFNIIFASFLLLIASDWLKVFLFEYFELRFSVFILNNVEPLKQRYNDVYYHPLNHLNMCFNH